MKLSIYWCIWIWVGRYGQAFVPGSSSRSPRHGIILRSSNTNGNKDDEAWDANVDYDKEWPQEKAQPDPSTAWDALPNMPSLPQLGIGVSLEPLNEQQAEDLKKEAQNIINSRIDEGIQDIEKLRKRMSKDMEQSRKIMELASEMEAQRQSEDLMKRIDKLTGDFLDSTKQTRTSTKMAAAASRAMEGTGKGIEMGTWGTLSGRTVVASSPSLLGSVENAVQEELRKSSGEKAVSANTGTKPVENRIILLADVKQDPLAKQLVPALTKRFEATDIPNCVLEVLAPTASIPLGGNNAQCVVVFCTSISQATSLASIMDKMLRKTLQANGSLGKPPTQLVGISTFGTERSEKFPYSVANFLGKLDQRRQVEEVLINTVQRRVSEPPLDFTLVKLGDVKPSAKEFSLRPGDSLDDAVTVETAAHAIVQAIAYQPFARNSTFSVSGSIPKGFPEADKAFWDDAFLCLEGPELVVYENVGDVSLYDKLLEYVQGWAEILADSGKGLTTPVQAVDGILSRSAYLVEEQDGVQLLFLPTKTGKYYMSKDEERQRESETGQKAGTAGASPNLRKTVREGGVDVVVEITKSNQLRVRARRCNYAPDAVIKELSEETILKRLEDAMAVWKKEIS